MRCPFVPRLIRFSLVLASVSVLFSAHLSAQTPWSAIGPDGGDARAFASVPGQSSHLYLGSTTGWVFESNDGGAKWTRLSRLDGLEDNLVVDHILVDPADHRRILAAAWTLGHSGGGLWVSQDGARSWTAVPGLAGQSIRSFVAAPSNPRILFAGTLDGVFRSTDAGATWRLISPAGSKEIHEIESLAVDPADPRIVYAGTWHLPWKTTDGGEHWQSIKQGIIDDSDVFSILVDPVQPKVLYLSACSGIYKSENAGALFHKIQGIPATARRTRVLLQDPVHHETVYAGTTEGLFRSLDAGKSFLRMTGPEVIVNDIHVDPADPRRVLLATDRGGVLRSTDAAASFSESNHGFSARMVQTLLVDRSTPRRLYAGLVNDKSFGGVYRSEDGGSSWLRLSAGLDGNDVFALTQTFDGTVLAGTNHGLFALQTAPDGSARWELRNKVVNPPAPPKAPGKPGKAAVALKAKPPLLEIAGRVHGLDAGEGVWVAATTDGLFTSRDQGKSWQGGAVLWLTNYQTVAVHGATMAAARLDAIVLSKDAGQSWQFVAMPRQETEIHQLAFTSKGDLWMAAREGLYVSHDNGQHWSALAKLPMSTFDDVAYDAAHDRVLVSSRISSQFLAIDPATLTWKQIETGYRVGLVRGVDGRLMAASLFDGLLSAPADEQLAPAAR